MSETLVIKPIYRSTVVCIKCGRKSTVIWDDPYHPANGDGEGVCERCITDRVYKIHEDLRRRT